MLLQKGMHSENSWIRDRCVKWLAVYLHRFSKLMLLVGWFLKASVPSSSIFLYLSLWVPAKQGRLNYVPGGLV